MSGSPRMTEKRYRSEDGLALYYRDFEPSPDAGGPTAEDAPMPAGTTVLCLPGLTRNSRDFLPLAAHLARRYRVLCPDLRGRGYSDRDPVWTNYQPATYVNDIWRLLDETGQRRVAVIGTSLGGLMAMVMTAQHADRVARVVLNDVGPEIDPAGLARIAAYTGRLPPVRDWAGAAAQAREVYGQAWPGLDEGQWLDMAHRGYREIEGVPTLDMDPKIGDALREGGVDLGDPWKLFGALAGTPTLVLRGALSDILSADILARMQAVHPAMESVEVPNRGHVPLLDEPVSLAAIDRFVEAV